ncbi:programmed cell death protein 2-like [Narcine bancroftii]|uniref:programmed cell death protein 2-like n=1 Tax=Narcine bancroftii TaxID=1343680 RepID=UPI0038322724
MSAAPSPESRPVLLGIRDTAVEEGNRCSWDTSKVGGTPDCVPGVILECPHCALCTAPLVHLVQVYCPLEGSPYHRTINVWACLQRECWGKCESWKVLRSQYAEVQSSRMNTEREPVPAVTDWCTDADDWCDEGGSEARISPNPGAAGCPPLDPDRGVSDQTSRLQTLSLREPAEAHAPCPPMSYFQPFYIAVMEDGDLNGQQTFTHEQELLQDYQRREGVTLTETSPTTEEDRVGAEMYEKSSVWHGDADFGKFMKRISGCPQQILRYCWGGKPLLLSHLPGGMDSIVPTCRNCGGRRVFEFQLMPALVSLLRSVNGKEASVEFGTVLIFTCKRSCWSPGNQNPLEECAVVQEEPDLAFFS